MNCPLCDQHIEATELKQHLVEAHGATDGPPTKRQKIEERFVCDQCNKEFASEQELKAHTRSVHRHRTSVTCPICSKTIRDKYNLSVHTKTCQRKAALAAAPAQPSTAPVAAPAPAPAAMPLAASAEPVTAPAATPALAPAAKPAPAKPAVPSAASTPPAKPAQAGPARFTCKECGASFKSQAGLDAHDQTHTSASQYTCSICNSTFQTKGNLAQHMIVHARQRQSKQPIKPTSHRPMPSDPFRIGNAQNLDDVFANPGLAAIYADNWRNIRSSTIRYRSFIHEYRLRLPNIRSPRQFLADIFVRQRSAFTLNLQVGFIMVNIETGEARFFYRGANTNVFPESVRISSRQDFREFMRRFDSIDLEEHCRQQRPNTKWVLYCMTTFSAMVTTLGSPIRAGHILPPWLRKRKGFIALDADQHSGRPFRDNLCVLRCLSLHRGADLESLGRPTKALLRQWLEFKQIDLVEFSGIGELELADFERCFEVAITAYELVPLLTPRATEEDEEVDGDDIEEQIRQEEQKAEAIKQRKFTAQLVRRSKRKDNPMTINLYTSHEGHVHASLITDLDRFAGNYQCKQCLMTFARPENCQRHERSCNGAATKEIFNGNGFCIKPNLFQRLEDEGINVPEDRRYFPYRGCFDFESTAEPRDYIKFTPLPHTRASLPAEDGNSFSPITGIYTIRDPNIDQIPEYVRAVAEQQQNRFDIRVQLQVEGGKVILVERKTVNGEFDYEDVEASLQLSLLQALLADRLFQAIEIKVFPCKQEFVAECVPASVAIQANIPGHDEPIFLLSNGDPQELVERFVQTLNDLSGAAAEVLLPQYQCYIDRLQECIDGYHLMIEDLRANNNITHRGKLTKQELSAMYKTDRQDFFHLKRCVKVNEQLLKDLNAWIRQLPILGFNSKKFDLRLIRPYLFKSLVAAGSSPRPIKKGTDYLQIQTDLLSFLDITSYMAPCSYSKWLKSYSIEESKSHWPHDIFVSLDLLKETRLPPQDSYFSTLKGCGITDEEYAELQVAWEREGMQTMADMLKYYNLLDVGPFMKAVDKMATFWKDQKLDMFRDAISLPGLALKQMLSTKPAHINFVLPDEAHKHLFYDVKSNLTGGPSIVFHRYHCADQTRINGGKLVKNIVGYDANALYLKSTMSRLPTGIPKIYTLHDDGRFHGKRMYKYAQAELEWIEYESHLRGEQIRHRFNYGKQIMIAGHQVDGYLPSRRQVFFFDGCWFHGHICFLNSRSGKQPPSDFAERRKRDFAIRQRLRALGYEVIVKNECDWVTEKKNDQRLKEFRAKYFILPSHGGPMTEAKLIQEIKRGRFFGLVKCSLNVPERLREYFDIFPCIFKNVELTRDVIGEHMLSFARKHEIMEQPRRTLVSSFFATNQLFATPLLMWYLEHGVEITSIQCAYEYFPYACFEQFGNDIADARRAADLDAAFAVLAELRKLIGNACYGKLITAIERHLEQVILDDTKAQRYLRSPYCANVDVVTDDLLEISLRKKKLVHELYNPLSFFVYQYAKQRVLEFQYDFIDSFIDRADYQLMETDTDSLYMAITGMCLDDIVKPELRTQYDAVKNLFLPRTGEFAKYDERTPGLFKLEASGNEMVCLNSKTYFLHGQKDKHSCKGLPKSSNKLTIEEYKKVLETGEPFLGVARGFKMMKSGHLGRLEQSRNGLGYYYAKRIVLEDGVSTKTIAIV